MHNRFRIIGGEWRGRRFLFPDEPGLRPSPDRVRETLFNWLSPVLPGARCADLFAGSGALGLEALSRGAASVEFVDRSRAALAAIDAHLGVLKCDAGSTVQADAMDYLSRPARPYDIVFLDPPFRQGLLAQAVSVLAVRGWVVPGGFVYMEAEVTLGLPMMPDGWTLHRSGKAGQVGFHLARTAR